MSVNVITAPSEAWARRRTAVAGARTTFLGDTWNVTVRELRPVLRQPASVLLPEVEHGSALQWFVPGIVTMTALMSASFTGANLTAEIQSGSHERLLVSPLRRSALLVGKAMREVVPLLLQTLIILAAVSPFGFDLHVAGVVVGVLLLVPFTIGLGALSLALALAAKDQDWILWTVQQTAIFPLLLLAGVLLPLDGAPGWLRLLADLNPMSYVVDAERALFSGSFPVETVAAGLGASVVVAGLGLMVGVRTMNRAA